MICGRNIVCLASSFYDHPTSKHHVMRVLSRENRVVWVNCHASRRPTLSVRDLRLAGQRLSRVLGGARQVAANMTVISPLLLPWPASLTIRRVNGWRLRAAISQALRRLPPAPTQLWIFTPDLPEVIDHAVYERVVYYCVDDFAAFDGFDTPTIEALEARTLALSDVVLATSQPLLERCAGRHANVHFAPHGVDFPHFAAAAAPDGPPVPAELASLPRPTLGFLGLVGEHVDLELLAAAAARRPDWSFVLVGTVRRDLGCVRDLRNVHVLGPRPYEALPGICRGLDIGLIPFQMTRLVRAVNPIKLREYLAAGLPVVTTPMPEVSGYGPAVRTARTCDEFVAATEACLELSRREPANARQALVASETWEALVARLAKIVAASPADARRGAACAPGGHVSRVE